MSETSTVSQSRERKTEPEHCVTASGSVPTRIFFGIASFTAISSETFPIRRRSQLEIGSATSPLKQFLPNIKT
jgi:hypothetical protein